MAHSNIPEHLRAIAIAVTLLGISTLSGIRASNGVSPVTIEDQIIEIADRTQLFLDEGCDPSIDLLSQLEKLDPEYREQAYREVFGYLIEHDARNVWKFQRPRVVASDLMRLGVLQGGREIFFALQQTSQYDRDAAAFRPDTPASVCLTL